MNGCMNGCPLIGLRRSPTAVSAQARLKRSDGACAHVCVFGAVAVEWRHVGLGCEGAHRGKWVSTGLERALVGKHAGCSRWHEGQGSWHSPLGVKEGRGDARNRGRPVHRDARRRGRRAGTGGVGRVERERMGSRNSVVSFEAPSWRTRRRKPCDLSRVCDSTVSRGRRSVRV